MWQHKTKFKNRKFLGTYEYTPRATRIFKLKDVKTGRETKPYLSHEQAKKDGWYRV